MAGFSRMYCVGSPGGFMGADGINPIWLEILVGDADRQWLECRYFEKKIPRLNRVKTLIPAKPNDTLMLLDACLVFLSDYFKNCPSMALVLEELGETTYLDFCAGDGVPKSWGKLRQEATEPFKSLDIWEATFVKYDQAAALAEASSKSAEGPESIC